jgi:hypothetical protein
MIPINVKPDQVKMLAETFDCQGYMLPFTYLGLLVGTTKPTIAELSPLVCDGL